MDHQRSSALIAVTPDHPRPIFEECKEHQLLVAASCQPRTDAFVHLPEIE